MMRQAEGKKTVRIRIEPCAVSVPIARREVAGIEPQQEQKEQIA
jgi:hypothetical protein